MDRQTVTAQASADAPGTPRLPAPLSALELAYGSTLEPMRGPVRAWSRAGRPPAEPADPATVRRLAERAFDALAAAVRPALTRPTCHISFSGGMDSSFVLAVAALVARTEGLPPPIPTILRFSDAPAADETARQDAVLQALARCGPAGRPLIHTIGDELDLVGPVARRMLDLVGPLVPANSFSQLLLMERAAGGVLLTGFGGDQLIGGHGRRLRRRTRALAALPVAVAAALRPPADLPWLRPDAARSCQRLVTARQRWRLLPPRQRLVREAGSRFTSVALTGLDRLAGAIGAGIDHPLFDPVFLARLADLLDVVPPLRRAEVYRMLAGDRLPAVVTQPHPKAALTQVFQRSATRRAVAAFDPDRLPADVRALVDVDGLRTVWRTLGPVRSTAVLLHLARPPADQPISPLSPLSPPAVAPPG